MFINKNIYSFVFEFALVTSNLNTNFFVWDTKNELYLTQKIKYSVNCKDKNISNFP